MNDKYQLLNLINLKKPDWKNTCLKIPYRGHKGSLVNTCLNGGDLNFCRELSSYFNEYVKLCPSLGYMTRHYRNVVSLVVLKKPVCEGLGKRASGHPVAWWVFRPVVLHQNPCVEETKATLNSSSVMSLLQGRCLVLCKGI